MAENSFVGTVHPPDPNLLGGNIPYNGLEWRSTREPDYKVFIYNVSARTFEGVGRLRMKIEGVQENDSVEVALGDPRDPWKHVDPKTGKPQKIRAGNQNEKWHFVTSFPQPILMTRANDASNMIEPYEQDAIRFAVDMICPDNLGKTLDRTINPQDRWSQGNDLSQKGVFYSLSNPPFQADVRAAIDRMEKYYQALLDEANTLELVDKKALSEKLVGNPDYAFAAEYFGQSTSWNRTPQRVEECANCGEKKPANRKFHMAAFGLCVERTKEAWQAVVEAGIRTPDQVPEQFRDVKKEKRPE